MTDLLEPDEGDIVRIVKVPFDWLTRSKSLLPVDVGDTALVQRFSRAWRVNGETDEREEYIPIATVLVLRTGYEWTFRWLNGWAEVVHPDL
jgi:hypothetical protein